MRAVLRGLGILCVALSGWAAQQAVAQGTDPDAAFVNEVITAELPGRSISALVTHKPGETKFTHADALFPGSPGYGNLRVEDGEIKYGQRGNFLVRARRHFLEEGFLTVVIDAPSDQQENFLHWFRESARYGEDVKGVLDAVSKKFGALDWTFVGTSEGSVSAAYVARTLSSDAKRVVLTSSLVTPSRGGRALSAEDIRKITAPVLWVHHRNDPCRYTQHSRVRQYAEETKTPLVTVTGAANVRGDACQAFTEHGFVGMEAKTVKAILSWIHSGKVPADVSE